MNFVIQPHRRIEGLDVLRGVAVLMVLLRHSWPDVFDGGGIVGVVIFFTLSGYLITGVLMSDLRKQGKVQYGRFYRNRAIRLLPALAFLLVVFAIVEGFFNLLGTREEVLRSLVVSATYTMNIPVFDHGSESLSHLWTLANEEQFYLIWPLVLALGVRFKRLRLICVVAVIGLLLLSLAAVAVSAPNFGRLYTLPTTWTIAMLIGAAGQLFKASLDRALQGARLNILASISGALLVGLVFVPDAKDLAVTYLVGGFVVGALTLIVIWAVRNVQTVPSVIRPLLWLGTISYAAYLWNLPVVSWFRGADLNFWPATAFVATIAMATISWWLVERPFSRLKIRLDARIRRSPGSPHQL